MLKPALLAALILLPQMAAAADLPRRARSHHTQRIHRSSYVERNRVITCTTSSFVLFTYSDCGQGLDPLAVATN